MAYVNPKIQEKLDSLGPDLKTAILAKNVPLNSLTDLIHVLERIVAEAE